MKANSKVQEALACAMQGFEKLQEAEHILRGGPASYYWETLQGYVHALFDKYAPFKADDRVELTGTPDTNNHWGVCRHFLIPGSRGVVHEVDYRSRREADGQISGHFVADVEFDNETWIDAAGKEQPVDYKHTFRLGEELLRKV